MRKAFRMGPALRIAAALMLAFCFCAPAFAAEREGAPEQTKGSIAVTLTEQEETRKAVSGAALRLHRVGYRREDGSYGLTSAFLGSGLVLTDLKAEALAGALAEYALANRIGGTTQETDAEGRAVFAGLAWGLYLIMQETPADGYYPIAPFLVSLPMTSEDGTHLLSSVDASPKVEPVPLIPAPPPPVTPEPPPMIQTGQLQWPTPVLAVAGLLLFAFGWALTYGKGRHDHEA